MLPGSSYAAPFVAGAIACWLEAAPSLSFDTVAEICRNASVPLMQPGDPTLTPIPEADQGAGVLDALRGLDLARRATTSL